jgi:hypothetical protein
MMKKLFLRDSKTSILLIALTCMFFINSCRKIEMPTEAKVKDTSNFFSVPSDAHPTVMRVAREMEAYNKKHEYISRLLKNKGAAVWDKSLVLYPKRRIGSRGAGGGPLISATGDTLVLIPLIPEGGDRVVSFLGASAGDDTIKVRIFNGDEYIGYGYSDDVTGGLDTLSAKSVAITHMLLETMAIPNRDSFKVLDPSLFYDSHTPEDTVENVIFSSETHDRTAAVGRASTFVFGLEEDCVSFRLHYPCRAFRTAGQKLVAERMKL